MASTHKSLRSGTANKRPTTSIADGQIALNTNAASPGLYFKDSTGASIIKIGPVHVGTTAPNVAPAGSSGNSNGETWLDTSLTPNGWKVWTGAAWVNATPVGSATVQGLLELATDAETQAGSDTARAVTPAGLQSKVSDSTSTTSSTTIASSTAVKSAYDLANAALPKSGGTVTGNLEIGTSGSLTFEGATADAFETTVAVVDPTADRTITLPNVTGTVVTSGDTGTVTSTMILDGTILNADINASAGIVDTKLATISTAGKVSNSATTAASANTASAIVARDASGNFSAGTITAALSGNASTVTTNANLTGDVTSVGNATSIAAGVIVDADVNASAAIAGTKISPDFGSQNVVTTGTATAASLSPTGSSVPTNGVYLPSANNVAISTNGSGKLFINSSGIITTDNGFTSSRFNVVNTNTVSTYDRMLLFRSSNLSNGFIGLGSDSFYIASASNAPLVFCTNSDGGVSGTSTPTNERMRLDSSGRLGLGTSGPSDQLEIANGTTDAANAVGIRSGRFLNGGQEGAQLKFYSDQTASWLGTREMARIGTYGLSGDHRIGSLAFFLKTTNSAANPSEMMRLTPTGLGIGTTAPSELLTVNGTTPAALIRTSNATGNAQIKFNADDTNYAGIGLESTALVMRCSNSSTPTERARIDSSGRLLVGTSSARGVSTSSNQNNRIQIADVGGSIGGLSTYYYSADGGTNTWNFCKSRGSSDGSFTIVNSGDSLGAINWIGADGNGFTSTAASISAAVDGTPGANDMPGRLVFSTTADGAASPTERMRLSANGAVRIPFIYTDTTATAANVVVLSDGYLLRSTSSRKYKTDIETIEDSYSDALLECRPVWYRSVSQKDNPDWGWWGFIAEEVAEIDPRLVIWKTTEVVYDDKGSASEVPCDPEPEGVAYDRFVPHLLNLIKRQQRAIESLEAKVAALEAS